MTTQHKADDAALAPTTVLVPLDGSALSELSVPLAHLLAARFRATVRTVTVGVDGTTSLRIWCWTANPPRRCSTISPTATGRWYACPATGMAASGAG